MRLVPRSLHGARPRGHWWRIGTREKGIAILSCPGCGAAYTLGPSLVEGIAEDGTVEGRFSCPVCPFESALKLDGFAEEVLS